MGVPRSMPLGPGVRLGPYEIVAPLGAGGMGEVYRATDTRLGRTVAIKVLATSVADDPQFRERFQREARTISSLNHAHICTLYDVGVESGMSYLVMEYLEGETLADRLTKGPMPLDDTLTIARQIADALKKAHSCGIVHRDLKPGNVMLTRTGAKLLDFGLAKAHDNSGAVSDARPGSGATMTAAAPLTARGSLLGTFQYMAPEQIEGEEADVRTDIWAFGCMLYEMATGKRAFEGKSQASIVAAVLERDPAPIAVLQPTAPRALDVLVRTCLAKDAEKRVGCAQDLKLQLEGVSAARAEDAGVRSPAIRAWMFTAAGAVLVAIAAVAFAWLRPVSRPVPTHSYLVPPPGLEIAPVGAALDRPALSPDGQRVAYFATSPRRLIIQSLETGQREIVVTDGGRTLMWSRDGRWIAFSGGRIGSGNATVFKVSASGGAPQEIVRLAGGGVNAWLDDGDFLLSTPDGLARVSASGGAPQLVVKLDPTRSENLLAMPALLPDGRHFLYLARNHNPSENAVYAGSLNGEPPKLVLRNESNAVYSDGYLLFVRGNTLTAQRFDLRTLTLLDEPEPVVSAAAVGGTQTSNNFQGQFAAANGTLVYREEAPEASTQLVLLPGDNRQPSPALSELASYIQAVFSPDGTRAAVTVNEKRKGDIWVVDLERKTRTRVTSGAGNNSNPSWSPDGRYIYFTSDRAANHHIYRRAADGSGAEETVVENQPNMEMTHLHSVSADGRYLVYTRSTLGSRTGGDIWALPLFGDRKPFAVAATEFNEVYGTLSPDSKWLAYTSDKDGRADVYVCPFPACDHQSKIADGPAFEPMWSADGRQLFYASVAAATLFRVDIDFRPSEPAIGKPESVVRGEGLRNIEVSADGRRILAMRSVNNGPQYFHLVTNWPALLRH